jgi:transcriptional regulator with XRE-family HTH domain
MSGVDPLVEHGIDLNALAVELIERTGLTRYRIAQETGISESALSNIASGRRRPSLEMICTIATLAGLTISVSVSDS